MLLLEWKGYFCRIINLLTSTEPLFSRYITQIWKLTDWTDYNLKAKNVQFLKMYAQFVSDTSHFVICLQRIFAVFADQNMIQS